MQSKSPCGASRHAETGRPCMKAQGLPFFRSWMPFPVDQPASIGSTVSSISSMLWDLAKLYSFPSLFVLNV